MKHALAALWLLALPGAAAADTLDLDLDHTRILFNVSHLGFTTQPGVFRVFRGDLDYDPERPEATRLSVVIDAASIDMFHERLNAHLRTEDFFHVEKFPEIRFVSTSVTPLEDRRARLKGNLTLLDETHPVTFEVRRVRQAPDPRDQRLRVGFEATGKLDRTNWGMTYGAPFVGAEVEFTLVAEAVEPEKAEDPGE